MNIDNRGRFQAQGQKLEESVNWAQVEPLYHCEALVFIESLKNKLTRRDLKIRKNAFAECIEYVNKVNKKGGIPAVHNKSFPKNYKERVDLEVHKDVAFLTKSKAKKNEI